MANENFIYSAGIQATHVPYKGENPALNDLIAVSQLSASDGLILVVLPSSPAQTLADLIAFNKADLVETVARDGNVPAPVIGGAVFVSALTGYGLDALRAALAALLAELWVDVDATVSYSAGELLARVRERGTVEMDYGEREVRVVGRAPLGDPIELEVRGYRLSIRRAEAARVALEPR